ncbi:SfnB family sulfur acquisition oxidoreductase [Methylobacterium sp. SD274]|uniref:SfnB family sulfur acquisition oxidoreductase n=1 Tax=Methylobacterium sp. SD274 TaxID=2782009 RepID=UPI001A956922|nr:SfnB family sulfur acquisition oxidoreductase [Methylobacterium sp. SD274]MBO1019295.1 SfnB family sulfur acquisition oxidoreductase [Methylobacterium sp. SD274]
MNIAVSAQSLETARGAPPVPRPASPAHVIRDDAEAIRVAHALAKEFREGASERDQTNRRPYAELDAFSQSGLWSINVPKAFGGPEVSYKTLAQVVAIISAADPSIGQISQNHLGIVAAIRTVSDPEQQALLFGEVLKGTRFGNAFSEIGTPRATDFKTHFVDDGDHVIVRGKKFYSTGALLAHLVPIVTLDGEGRAWYAIAERGAPGLTVIDDWSAFGQRTTASGTVIIDDVRVPKTHLVPAWKGYEQPRSDGAIFQIIQAAVDAGIAREAIDDTIAFVRTKTRPWVDSGQDRASDDPYTIQAIGELTIRLHAAEAILDKAGLALDEAVANPSAETVAAAQLAVAESKVLTTEIAVQASSKLFELAGTRSTLAESNLDRHWRNARTHTLHDPVRWKYAIIGNHALNGVNPPFHAWS